MSTRGAYGFRLNGVDKVTYLPGESEPPGFGLSMADFVGNTSKTRLQEIAAKLQVVNGTAAPSTEQVAECSSYAEPRQHERAALIWSSVLHSAQGNLETLGKGLRYMVDGSTFLLDSEFCEWAYIVDLDEDTLEIHRGFQKHLGSGRYNHRMHTHGEFTGVALLQAIPLAVFRALSKEDGRHLMEAIHTLCLHAEGKLSAAVEDEEFDRAKTVFKRLMAVDIALSRLQEDMPDHDFLHQTEESTANADDLLREVYGHRDALPAHLAQKLEHFFTNQ
jgi:hypothetical protein